jgi:L-malate glycosyltransferase
MADKFLVFVWENYGNMHVDRCAAVAKTFSGRRKVIGIELGGYSDTYNWNSSSPLNFKKITLFPANAPATISQIYLFIRLLWACISLGRADFFFCHYEHPVILLTAAILRICRRRVYIMNDSKFDDKPRHLYRELLKPFFFLPYNGALVSGRRAKDYLEFLRFPTNKILVGYDSVSIERIRCEALVPPAPEGVAFKERHFVVIARLVPKKNLYTVLEAYANYTGQSEAPRQLHICGTGPLMLELQARAASLGIAEWVVFHGHLPPSDIAKILANTLALLLISTEEQFGLVVPEALALGVPVIVSQNCGARDDLVRAGVNGFLVEPDNVIGIAFFMRQIAEDIELWKKLAINARETASKGDVKNFVNSVGQLTNVGEREG